jgi:hypothetical protein
VRPETANSLSACRLSKRKIDLYLTPRSFYCPLNPQLRQRHSPGVQNGEAQTDHLHDRSTQSHLRLPRRPSKLRQWLTALHFLDPNIHPGHVIYHKLRVTTQDIEDWVTHLKDHGGYVYLC